MKFVASSITLAAWMLGSSFAVLAQSGDRARAMICIEDHLEKTKQNPSLGVSLTDVEKMIFAVSQKIGLPSRATAVPCSFGKLLAVYPTPTDKIPLGEYIVYNPDWIYTATGDQRYQLVALMGHELGHFLAAHFTSKASLSVLEKEKQADAFAGCAVAKLEGSFAALSDVLPRIRHGASDGMYPSLEDSLASAKNGFMDCGGSIDGKSIQQLSRLINYTGPNLNTSLSDLMMSYTNGIWGVIPASGKFPAAKYYEISTVIHNINGKMRFYVHDQTGLIESIAFSLSQHYNNNLAPGDAPSPDADQEEQRTDRLCTTTAGSILQSLIKEAFGIRGSPEIVNVDESGAEMSKCTSDPSNSECSAISTTRTATYRFNSYLNVSYDIIRTDFKKSFYRSMPFTKRAYFQNHTGGCALTVNVSTPQAPSAPIK